MRRDTGVDRITRLVDRGELEALRDHMRFAAARHPSILNRVFQQEDRREAIARVSVIDQDRALPHDLFILLADQADHRFQQRVPRTDKGRYRLLIDQAFFEADPLVSPRERAVADQAVALAEAWLRFLRALIQPTAAWSAFSRR